MATLFTEDCEGTNAATVTTGNSNFDALTGTATKTFDNTRVKEGSTAIKVVCSANFFTMEDAYTSSGVTRYARFYLNPDTAPSASTRLFAWFSSGTLRGEVRYLTNGTLQLRSETSTQLAVTTNTLTVDEWNRIEVKFTPGAELTLRLYKGNAACDNAAGSYTEQITGDPGSGTTANEMHFGTGSVTWTAWFDAIVVQDTDWVGPLAGVAVTLLRVGSSTPSALYVGSTLVDAAYMGSTKVWD